MAIAPPPTLHLQQQWLPTLSSIVLDGDSFSTDLIRQFDKKQSRLHAEMVGENVSLSSDSYQSRTRTPEAMESTEQVQPLDRPQHTQDDNSNDRNEVSSLHLRRRSAGDLLRRSSAYLRAKFEAFKSIAPPTPIAPQQHQQSQDLVTLPPPGEQRRSVFHSWSISKRSQQRYQPPHADTIFGSSSHESNEHPSTSATSVSSLGSIPPTKIAVNTTISIPHNMNQQRHDPRSQHPPQSQQNHQHRHTSLYHYTATVQPPIITQYPPRPLKYAPVEPISDDDIPHPSDDNLGITTTIHTSKNRGIHHKQSVEHPDSHHHRISLPLFKMIKDSTATASSSSSLSDTPRSRHSRRSSDSDIHRIAGTKTAPLPSWTRRLSQWFHCQQSAKLNTPPKKGKEPKNATANQTTRGATTSTNVNTHSLAI